MQLFLRTRRLFEIRITNDFKNWNDEHGDKADKTSKLLEFALFSQEYRDGFRIHKTQVALSAIHSKGFNGMAFLSVCLLFN